MNLLLTIRPRIKIPKIQLTSLMDGPMVKLERDAGKALISSSPSCDSAFGGALPHCRGARASPSR